MLQKRKKVLFVLRQGWSVLSARIRASQYRDMFDVDPEWEAEYIDIRSERLENWISRAQALRLPYLWSLLPKILRKYEVYWSRKHEAEIIKKARTCDIVYFFKGAQLPLFKKIKAIKKPKLCMDFVDGLWLPNHRNCFGGEPLRLEEILEVTDAVICENNFTAAYAKNYCKSVYIVPDAPPIDKFNKAKKAAFSQSKRVVVGWVGSSETSRPLICLLDSLDKLAESGLDFELRVLGCSSAPFAKLENLPCQVTPHYDEAAMVEELLNFDIGLFPLSNNQDAVARGVGKALVYMAAGIAVVAQNRGEVMELIDSGHNGFLADTNSEWIEIISKLVRNDALRTKVARNGNALVKERYSKSKIFLELKSIFDKESQKIH